MKCYNCGSEEFVTPEGAEGGIQACAKCNIAVDPAADDQPVGGGVAPVPAADEVALAPRPDTPFQPTGEPVTLPAKSASRSEWDEVAVKLGIDPAAYSNKDDLIKVVEEAVESLPDTSQNAPEPDGNTNDEEQG